MSMLPVVSLHVAWSDAQTGERPIHYRTAVWTRHREHGGTDHLCILQPYDLWVCCSEWPGIRVAGRIVYGLPQLGDRQKVDMTILLEYEEEEHFNHLIHQHGFKEVTP
jgi:hypothetical protein